MNKKPKILLYDIETSLSVVATFSLFNQYIGHENILQDWNILSAAWKWLGEKRVHSIHVWDDVENDKEVVKALAAAISEADIIVGHNSAKFDLKKLNTRLLYHRLPPLDKRVLQIDTLKAARKHFAFTSNRLDYLGEYLGIGGKKPTPNGLWRDILKGNKRKIMEMVAYNKHDVSPLLEGVYTAMRPYIDHPNMGGFFDDGREHCPNCGSDKIHKHDKRPTKAGALNQRYRCTECASISCKKIHEAPKLK